MNIGMFCPLPLCTLTGNFRIYFHIVCLVVIMSSWVCDNWVYRFPKLRFPSFSFPCFLGTAFLFSFQGTPCIFQHFPSPSMLGVWLELRFRGPGRGSLGAKSQKVSRKVSKKSPRAGSQKSENSLEKSPKSPKHLFL